MRAAIAAVYTKTATVRQVAIQHIIPYTTLIRYTKGKYEFKGLPTELTAEEEKEIVAWVIDVSKRGFPLTQPELKDCVQLYLNKADRVTKFNDNRPGHWWINAFLKRHPILTMRMAENIDKNRAKVTESMIRNWFQKVRSKFIYLLGTST